MGRARTAVCGCSSLAQCHLVGSSERRARRDAARARAVEYTAGYFTSARRASAVRACRCMRVRGVEMWRGGLVRGEGEKVSRACCKGRGASDGVGTRCEETVGDSCVALGERLLPGMSRPTGCGMQAGTGRGARRRVGTSFEYPPVRVSIIGAHTMLRVCASVMCGTGLLMNTMI